MEANNSDAWASELLASVQRPVWRYLSRRAAPHLAADALSDSLVVLWRRAAEVPRDEPLPYAYNVARRCLSNVLRSGRRQHDLAARIVALDPPSDTAGPEASLPDADLAAALASLPEDDREVLTLWAWEGLEPRDLAVALDITSNAARVRLHRARTRLRTVYISDSNRSRHA